MGTLKGWRPQSRQVHGSRPHTSLDGPWPEDSEFGLPAGSHGPSRDLLRGQVLPRRNFMTSGIFMPV